MVMLECWSMLHFISPINYNDIFVFTCWYCGPLQWSLFRYIRHSVSQRSLILGIKMLISWMWTTEYSIEYICLCNSASGPALIWSEKKVCQKIFIWKKKSAVADSSAFFVVGGSLNVWLPTTAPRWRFPGMGHGKDTPCLCACTDPKTLSLPSLKFLFQSSAWTSRETLLMTATMSGVRSSSVLFRGIEGARDQDLSIQMPRLWSHKIPMNCQKGEQCLQRQILLKIPRFCNAPNLQFSLK